MVWGGQIFEGGHRTPHYRGYITWALGPSVPDVLATMDFFGGGHTCDIQKFLGQGSNLHHGSGNGWVLILLNHEGTPTLDFYSSCSWRLLRTTMPFWEKTGETLPAVDQGIRMVATLGTKAFGDKGDKWP